MTYPTIVIDISWPVKNNLQDTRFYRCGGHRMPYKAMTEEQILNFPINDFASENCDLFMWVIKSKMRFAFDILDKWGFKFMDCISWDKEIGIGVNGIYRQTELCYYAYRGKMGINKKGKFIRDIIREKREKHSQKPKSFYQMIRPNTQEPRIDIFARIRHEGFDAYGNQVEQVIQKTLTQEGLTK